MRRIALLSWLALACACDGSMETDAGAAPVDAAVEDAGPLEVDAGPSDAGRPDAGPPSVACEASGLSCSADEYCDRGTGRCLGPGRCMSRPTECTGPTQPVCGCDGLSYVSACAAWQAGVSIASDGPC